MARLVTAWQDPDVPDEMPDTVTEAVALLRRLGYTEDLVLHHEGIAADDELEALGSAVVEHRYRFEGNSDPADEAIVLGVACPGLGRRGVLVAGFGPSMAPEHVQVLHALLGTP